MWCFTDRRIGDFKVSVTYNTLMLFEVNKYSLFSISFLLLGRGAGRLEGVSVYQDIENGFGI